MVFFAALISIILMMTDGWAEEGSRPSSAPSRQAAPPPAPPPTPLPPRSSRADLAEQQKCFQLALTNVVAGGRRASRTSVSAPAPQADRVSTMTPTIPSPPPRMTPATVTLAGGRVSPLPDGGFTDWRHVPIGTFFHDPNNGIDYVIQSVLSDDSIAVSRVRRGIADQQVRLGRLSVEARSTRPGDRRALPIDQVVFERLRTSDPGRVSRPSGSHPPGDRVSPVSGDDDTVMISAPLGIRPSRLIHLPSMLSSAPIRTMAEFGTAVRRGFEVVSAKPIPLGTSSFEKGVSFRRGDQVVNQVRPRRGPPLQCHIQHTAENIRYAEAQGLLLSSLDQMRRGNSYHLVLFADGTSTLARVPDSSHFGVSIRTLGQGRDVYTAVALRFPERGPIEWDLAGSVLPVSTGRGQVEEIVSNLFARSLGGDDRIVQSRGKQLVPDENEPISEETMNKLCASPIFTDYDLHREMCR